MRGRAGESVRIDLELLLPSVNEADPCIERLISTLDGRSGVERVHVVREDGRAHLCLHFDPDRLTVARVEALTKAAGLELAGRYVHLDLPVRGLSNERRARVVASRLGELEGVIFATASAAASRVHVELDPAVTGRAQVIKALRKAGLEPAREPREEREHEEHVHGGIFGAKTEVVFAALGGALTLSGWMIESLASAAGAWVSVSVYVAAYLFGGLFAVRETFDALRARRLEIDFLMLVAAVGAAALGEWGEGALLLFLFSIGHALEGYAMGRARRAIESLADLTPQTALRIRADGTEEEVPVDRLTIGDRVRVRPNSRIASDGFVIEGHGAVNQAPITGESMPVDKQPVPDRDAALRAPAGVAAHSRVFAGTINGTSALKVVVTRPSTDSTLARVLKMVREAETQASPTQRFTDRFERIFVPSVLSLATVSLFAWTVLDEPFSASFYRAMALLVAASPCALAIATPSAVLSGVARAARSGVLIKGGAHLEMLGLVRTVAFDKTGTLTRGEPRLTDVVCASSVTEVELLSVAAAVEQQSDHPLAAAVVEGARERVDIETLDASRTEAIVGYGVRASIDGELVHLGKPDLYRKTLGLELPDDVATAVESLLSVGRTTVVVHKGERFLGVLGLLDPPRGEASAAIAALRRVGIRRMLMLSGDHQRAADAVAAMVGLDAASGDLLPDGKVSAISELASEGPIAMIGDGVNDAPALARASVGIAMGAGGSDVALETADVALMADDLSKLPFAVGLSRASRAIILQNLWASLGMVAFLVPATLFGFAGIGVAVVLHEGSTLLVVANALRLLAYRDPAEVPRSRPSLPGSAAVLAALLVLPMTGCGAGGADDGEPLPPQIYVPVEVPVVTGREPKVSRIVYLNREGAMLEPGLDESSANRSQIVSLSGLESFSVPAFHGTARAWERFTTCLRAHFEPYDVEIVEQRPVVPGYVMAVIGGEPGELMSASVALRSGTLLAGLAPYNAQPVENAIVLVFARSLRERPEAVCETAATEIAHAYGLDHSMRCDEIMSYVRSCGRRRFLDRALPCGEYEARPCGDGNPTQSSHRRLLDILGSRRAEAASER